MKLLSWIYCKLKIGHKREGVKYEILPAAYCYWCGRHLTFDWPFKRYTT